MCTILPFVMPPIETYQSSSFILGIILAHNHIKNVYHNNYINWGCNDTDKLNKLKLKFVNVTWEDYRYMGIAEMDMYRLKNIDQKCFVNFIKERIDQGNYILLYEIDEFFLSYSTNYTTKHFIHDTYIYGYNTDSFCIMAYSNKKLRMLTIPFNEILNAMYHCLCVDPNISFCTFRPNHAISVKIDYNQMLQTFMDYIDENKQYNDNRVYGVRVYSILQKCILSFINNLGNGMKIFDLKVFRMLWEHKKVLRNHIKLLNGNIIDKIDEIERISNIVFSLAIKYDITYNNLLLYRIMHYIDEIKQKEIDLIQTLIYS